jgi:hypothetical protein
MRKRDGHEPERGTETSRPSAKNSARNRRTRLITIAEYPRRRECVAMAPAMVRPGRWRERASRNSPGEAKNDSPERYGSSQVAGAGLACPEAVQGTSDLGVMSFRPERAHSEPFFGPLSLPTDIRLNGARWTTTANCSKDDAMPGACQDHQPYQFAKGLG